MDNDTYEIQGEWHQRLIDKYIPRKQASGKYETCLINVFNGTVSSSNSSYESSCHSYVYSKEFYSKTLVTTLHKNGFTDDKLSVSYGAEVEIKLEVPCREREGLAPLLSEMSQRGFLTNLSWNDEPLVREKSI